MRFLHPIQLTNHFQNFSKKKKKYVESMRDSLLCDPSGMKYVQPFSLSKAPFNADRSL